MHRRTPSCRRLRNHLSAASPFPSYIWISDSSLDRAFNRFIRLTAKRYGSNVPGPLEAQRRLARRRMAGLTVHAPPTFHVGALFGFKCRGVPEPVWQPPNSTPQLPMVREVVSKSVEREAGLGTGMKTQRTASTSDAVGAPLATHNTSRVVVEEEEEYIDDVPTPQNEVLGSEKEIQCEPGLTLSLVNGSSVFEKSGGVQESSQMPEKEEASKSKDTSTTLRDVVYQQSVEASLEMLQHPLDREVPPTPFADFLEHANRLLISQTKFQAFLDHLHQALVVGNIDMSDVELVLDRLPHAVGRLYEQKVQPMVMADACTSIWKGLSSCKTQTPGPEVLHKLLILVQPIQSISDIFSIHFEISRFYWSSSVETNILIDQLQDCIHDTTMQRLELVQFMSQHSSTATLGELLEHLDQLTDSQNANNARNADRISPRVLYIIRAVTRKLAVPEKLHKLQTWLHGLVRNYPVAYSDTSNKTGDLATCAYPQIWLDVIGELRTALHYPFIMSCFPEFGAVEACRCFIIYHFGHNTHSFLSDWRVSKTHSIVNSQEFQQVVTRFEQLTRAPKDDDNLHYENLLTCLLSSPRKLATMQNFSRLTAKNWDRIGLLRSARRMAVLDFEEYTASPTSAARIVLWTASFRYPANFSRRRQRKYADRVWTIIKSSLLHYSDVFDVWHDRKVRWNFEDYYMEEKENLTALIEWVAISAALDKSLTNREAFAAVEYINRRAREYRITVTDGLLKAFIWTIYIRNLQDCVGYSDQRDAFGLELLNWKCPPEVVDRIQDALSTWREQSSEVGLKLRDHEALSKMMRNRRGFETGKGSWYLLYCPLPSEPFKMPIAEQRPVMTSNTKVSEQTGSRQQVQTEEDVSTPQISTAHAQNRDQTARFHDIWDILRSQGLLIDDAPLDLNASQLPAKTEPRKALKQEVQPKRAQAWNIALEELHELARAPSALLDPKACSARNQDDFHPPKRLDLQVRGGTGGQTAKPFEDGWSKMRLSQSSQATSSAGSARNKGEFKQPKRLNLRVRGSTGDQTMQPFDDGLHVVQSYQSSEPTKDLIKVITPIPVKAKRAEELQSSELIIKKRRTSTDTKEHQHPRSLSSSKPLPLQSRHRKLPLFAKREHGRTPYKSLMDNKDSAATGLLETSVGPPTQRRPRDYKESAVTGLFEISIHGATVSKDRLEGSGEQSILFKFPHADVARLPGHTIRSRPGFSVLQNTKSRSQPSSTPLRGSVELQEPQKLEARNRDNGLHHKKPKLVKSSGSKSSNPLPKTSNTQALPIRPVAGRRLLAMERREKAVEKPKLKKIARAMAMGDDLPKLEVSGITDKTR